MIAVQEMIAAKRSFPLKERIAGKSIVAQGRSVENPCVGPMIRNLPRIATELTPMSIQCSQDQSVADARLQGDERIAKRRFSDFEVAISGTTGNRFKGITENISESGCFVSINDDAELAAGRMISLTLPDGKVVSGAVVWSHKSAVGIRFLVPLEAEVVDDLVKRSLLARLARFKPSMDPTDMLTSLPKWGE